MMSHTEEEEEEREDTGRPYGREGDEMEVGYVDPDPVNVANRISPLIRLVQYRTLDLDIIQKDHTYDDHYIPPWSCVWQQQKSVCLPGAAFSRSPYTPLSTELEKERKALISLERHYTARKLKDFNDLRRNNDALMTTERRKSFRSSLMRSKTKMRYDHFIWARRAHGWVQP
jgi:hypothetical protein